MPRRRLEPHGRLRGLPRADLPNVPLHLVVPARVARRPHLLEQTCRAQLGVPSQARLDDPLERIQLRRARPPGTVSALLVPQATLEQPVRDPVVQRPPADPDPAGDLRPAHPLVQIVPGQNPLLSLEHCASLVEWRRQNTPTRPRLGPRPAARMALATGPAPCHLRCPHVCNFGRPVTRSGRTYPAPRGKPSGYTPTVAVSPYLSARPGSCYIRWPSVNYSGADQP